MHPEKVISRDFRTGVRLPSGPPKILGSNATENFYLLPLHSSLFTSNAPENFEVRSKSEEVRSESYIGSDLCPNAPPKKNTPSWGVLFLAEPLNKGSRTQYPKQSGEFSGAMRSRIFTFYFLLFTSYLFTQPASRNSDTSTASCHRSF